MEDFFLAIDLGGTNTKLGIGSSSGKLIQATSVPTLSEHGPENWVERIKNTALGWNLPFKAIGIGSPGPLDTKTGIILETPNLKSFESFSIKKAFEQAFKKNVYIENDANCGALAEYTFGPYKGTGHITVITLGTGVGSGVVHDHKLIRGVGGFAVELGHMAVHQDEFDLTKHMKGTYEGYISAPNALGRFRKLNSKHQVQSIKEIFDLAAKGDPDSEAFFEQWVRQLAVGIYNVYVLFNPEVIILAGGISASWNIIQPRLDHFLNAWVPKPLLQSSKVDISKLGEFFGVYGALALALQESRINGRRE